MTTSPTPDRREMLREALLAIDDLQAKLDAATAAAHEPIAIVGMSCRFPGGANSPEAYWELLAAGRDAVSTYPADRSALLEASGIVLDEPLTYPGGFVDGIDQFDPAFFGISPREAASMDPQQRMVLEASWEALERAAIAPDSLKGSDTGIFVGITGTDYVQLGKLAGPDSLDVYSATGGALNAAPGRVAYTLGLQGPSVAIDTACSSSLVAIHQACTSLRTGETDLALAGGVNLLLLPEAFVTFERWGMMAPDGRCKTFDAAADGFVRSEGCGMIVLKRLRDAQAAGDPILALIRGSAVNQDGASSGLTVPNGPAQEAVVRRALTNAGVAPADIDYFEAHGTGTTLGDPIEVEALGAVLGTGRSTDQPLRLGSVKTNLGHLESAAGVAGLIKVVLAMQHEQIPPHLHLEERSPQVPWPDFPVEIPTEPTAWPSTSPRFAGVSGFGFSGTNAHIVLESAPSLESVRAPEGDGPGIVALTAASPAGLHDLAARAADVPDLAFDAAVATLAAARAALPHRLAVVGSDRDDLRKKLHQVGSGSLDDAITGTVGRAPRLGFVYSGQGSQYIDMAAGLMRAEPIFGDAVRDVAARIDDQLRTRMHDAVPLLDVIAGTGAGADGLVHRTGYTQPALFAIQVGLTRLWASWGIRPTAVLGHSIGEIAAAVTADVLDLDSAVALITARSSLMEALPDGGAMAAVSATAAEVEAALADLEGPVSIAAVNGPANTVVSGRADLVDAAGATLTALGRRVTPLDVSHAFHSPLMAPMIDEFSAAAARLPMRTPTVPMFSTVTGALADDSIATAAYWVHHIERPVRFADAAAAMAASGVDTFIEIGPHPVLSVTGRDIADGEWIGSLRRDHDDRQHMLGSLGRLHAVGARVDWTGVYGEFDRVVAPTTPFDKRSHWFPPVTRSVRRTGNGHPLLGHTVDMPALGATVHEAEIAADAPAWLADHRLGGTVVFPGTGYVDIALAAANGATISSLSTRQPLVFASAAPVVLQTTVGRRDGDNVVTIGSRDGESWTVHAEARLGPPVGNVPDSLDLDSVEATFPDAVDVPEYYASLRELGLDYGAAFTGLTELRRGRGQAIGRVRLADEVETSPHHVAHPALLDACFHVLGVAVDMDDGEMGVPVRLDGVVSHRPVETAAWCRAELLDEAADGSVTARIVVFDDDGAPALEIAELEVRPTPASMWTRLGQGRPDTMYDLDWQGQERSADTRDTRWLIAGDGPSPAAVAAALPGPATTVALDADEIEAAITAAEGPVDVVVLTDSAWILASIAQRIARHQAAASSLTLVTRGAVSVEGEAPDHGPAAAWGCGASLAAELGDRWAGSIDVDPTPRPTEADELAAELAAADRELSVALRGGRRFVPRLARAARPAGAAGSRRLELTARGSVDNLELVPQAPLVPAAGEITVAVRSTGLNFRDVLNVLGMFPGEPGPPGLECAGVVTAVGADVTDLAVGDHVVGIAANAYDDLVVTPAKLMAKLPPMLSFAEGATLPIAFLTATYGLERLAALQPGERVLIHAGTGGVGMAAIQVAQRIGAEVYATAGSDAKRALLRELGVRHVYDSRSLDFAAQIRAETDGAGVDVALNSLADDFVTATFALMADGGRFLEIGKRGILTPEQAASTRPDVAYHPYDLADFLAQDVDDINAETVRVTDLVARGEFRPLPLRSFAHHEISDAFRFMAQARHVGKVVIDHRRSGDVVRPDATYLVTGGLGGLGLAVGEWLASAGAGRVILASRSTPDADAQATIERMSAAGASVDVRALDIADDEAVSALVASIAATEAPLRGVIHAAGVTDDGALAHQTAARFEAVAAAKVAGTIALDRATHAVDLDWFVAFSSASAILGSAGQVNYAAANRAMDAIMLGRRAAGRVATTVNWGAWAEAGMAARLPEAQLRRMEANGVRGLTNTEAMEALEEAIRTDAARVVVGGFDWPAFSAAVSPRLRPLLDAVSSTAPGPASAPAVTVDLIALLDEHEPDARRRALQGLVADNLTAVLGLDPREPIDPDLGLSDLGMDSLMAVELSNRLAALVEADLASTVAFEHPTIRGLTDHLVTILGDRVDFGGRAADGPGDDGLTAMDTEALTSALLSELDDVGF